MAGYCPKKCSTVSSDPSQLGHIIVRDLLMEVFVEYTVPCNHVEDGTVAHGTSRCYPPGDRIGIK